MADNLIRKGNITMNFVTFLLLTGGIAYWVVKQAKKNSEADRQRNFSEPPLPEVHPDATPIPELWGHTTSLDDLLNPIPYETKTAGELTGKQSGHVMDKAERNRELYRTATNKKTFAKRQEQAKRERGDERNRRFYKEEDSEKTGGKLWEHKRKEEQLFGQEGERVSKDMQTQTADLKDSETGNEKFIIHSAAEARKAIVWGEILQRKHF